MIENIKRIGLFMIVAQMFVHFAAGQQYEKYMKIIAGVIVLLLFIDPFSSESEDVAENWQKEMERMTEQIEYQSSIWQKQMPETDFGTGNRVLRGIEEEIKGRLNLEISSDDYIVTDVIVEWEEDGSQSVKEEDMNVGSVRITLCRTVQGGDASAIGSEDAVDLIEIERIQIGGRPDGLKAAKEDGREEGRMQEYRGLFARILGIEEEKVEVVYGGSG